MVQKETSTTALLPFLTHQSTHQLYRLFNPYHFHAKIIRKAIPIPAKSSEARRKFKEEDCTAVTALSKAIVRFVLFVSLATAGRPVMSDIAFEVTEIVIAALTRPAAKKASPRF
jgi:hypothetical protein